MTLSRNNTIQSPISTWRPLFLTKAQSLLRRRAKTLEQTLFSHFTTLNTVTMFIRSISIDWTGVKITPAGVLGTDAPVSQSSLAFHGKSHVLKDQQHNRRTGQTYVDYTPFGQPLPKGLADWLDRRSTLIACFLFHLSGSYMTTLRMGKGLLVLLLPGTAQRVTGTHHRILALGSDIRYCLRVGESAIGGS